MGADYCGVSGCDWRRHSDSNCNRNGNGDCHANCDSNRDTDNNSNCDCNRNSDCNPNRDADGFSNRDSFIDSYGFSNLNTETYTNPEERSTAKASAESASKTLTPPQRQERRSVACEI